MRTPEVALLWSFWRNSQGPVGFALTCCLMICSIGLIWPSTTSSGILYYFAIAASVFGVRASTMISDHHLLLPVSTWRLSLVACGYTFFVSGLLCSLTMGGLVVLGGHWDLAVVVFACSVLGVIVAAVANIFFIEGQEGFEVFVAILFSTIIVNLLGLTPNSTALRIESLYQLRWPILISSALLAWMTLCFAIRFRRRTGESPALWLKRFDVSLSGVWRPGAVTPSSRLDAVIELDWRRFFEGGLVGMISLVFALLLLCALTEDQIVFVVWLFVGAMVPYGAYFFLLGYTSYDQTKNGGFRWTMPVSDTELAYGMLRALFRMVMVLWFTWVVGLIVLLVVNGIQGRNLIDTLRGPQRDFGTTGTYLLLFGIAAGSMLVGWVGASIGLVHNYVGRAKERVIVLAVHALPVAVLFLLELYMPQPYHFTVVQIIGGVVGALIMVRTVRMYSFAYRAEHLSVGRIRFLLLIWLIGAACFVVPLIWVGVGAGIAILCGGFWHWCFIRGPVFRSRFNWCATNTFLMLVIDGGRS